MAAIHIRDVPEETLSALKRRAARNERSLQRELRHILSALAEQEPPPEPHPPLRLHLSEAGVQSDWSREEIYGGDGR